MIMWMRLLFTSLAAFFLLTGCVSIEKSYPDKRYFVLDIALDPSLQDPAETGTLQISSARVSPRYADKNFVYRRSDARFESDFYNEFLVSPGVLVAEELRQGLSQSGLFKFVVSSVNALAPTHTLETVVNTLYGDFRDLGAPQAVMEIEFFLSREESPSGIVFHKHYHRTIPLKGRNPEALVQGWNQALEAISRSLVTDLKASNVHLGRRSNLRQPAFSLG
ncbi:MAG TPA: ABC-type transport auxiliary lipoprotein family protein [Candidatus Binatia bacterium]|nr:ABC-type transport auxiliary lipoprotein family protein [Candidatus Binatia bacterium]